LQQVDRDDMSNFTNHRGPNVSQYIANLNNLPSQQELATEQQPDFNIPDDLALFTNTQFFDFDMSESGDIYSPYKFSPHGVATDGSDPLTADSVHNPPPTPSFVSPTSEFAPGSGRQREGSIAEGHQPLSLEESSRIAAEEDKRRRNTAASARFRVKKKQREQALERTAKEKTEEAERAWARVSQLEMENKLLKDLLTEKNGTGDMAELYKKLHGKDQVSARRPSSGKDGVGTPEKKN
jgi:hypothetical protein